ncbi:hypothetical protein [uncultured Neisseria sp.]|nr:hypothetical protein [uncultured Neisseria sp.]
MDIPAQAIVAVESIFQAPPYPYLTYRVLKTPARVAGSIPN